MLSVTRRVSNERIEWIELNVGGEKVYVGLASIKYDSRTARLVVDARREVVVRRVHTRDGCTPRAHPHEVVSDMNVDGPPKARAVG